jgi:hypothetical protein
VKKQPTHSLGNEAVGLFYEPLSFFWDLYDKGEDKERKKIELQPAPFESIERSNNIIQAYPPGLDFHGGLYSLPMNG